MLVIEEEGKKLVSLPAKPMSEKQVRAVNSALARKILFELAKKPTYPMALAKKLKVHEQKVYYHVRNLEKVGLIEVMRKEDVHGTSANIYAPTAPAFVFSLKEFAETRKLPGTARPVDFLSPIILNNELNGLVIVGSPDPHGPEMARSRDGYYGIDLAMFLGTFMTNMTELSVRLDTEVRSEDLQRNLILIGGPVVNVVTQKLNEKMPLRFDQKKNWAITSTVSGKTYQGDECGVIVKMKNPFNPKKWVLVVAGKRHHGTRAVTITFLKYFDELVKGNAFDEAVQARVVEGLDRDADGIVDDIRFIE